MYAIVKTGGKQYRVSAGDEVTVEKLAGETGDKVALSDVLAVNDGKATTIGAPLVKDAVVNAEIVAQGKGDKVIIFKKKRRHNYRRKLGHRQEQTVLKILDINGKGEAPAKKEAAKPAAKKADAAPAEAKKEAKPAAKKETAAKKPAAKKPAAKKAEKKEEK